MVIHVSREKSQGVNEKVLRNCSPTLCKKLDFYLQCLRLFIVINALSISIPESSIWVTSLIGLTPLRVPDTWGLVLVDFLRMGFPSPSLLSNIDLGSLEVSLKECLACCCAKILWFILKLNQVSWIDVGFLGNIQARLYAGWRLKLVGPKKGVVSVLLMFLVGVLPV